MSKLAPLPLFKHPCICGGHAWRMNGRPEASPHMYWCPQRAEYIAWFKHTTHLKRRNRNYGHNHLYRAVPVR